MIELSDDEIFLRDYLPEDRGEYALAVNESEDTVGLWMEWWKKDYAEKDALDWFKFCKESKDLDRSYEFGIFLKTTGRYLGGAGINQVDKVNGAGNIGYWVRESYQKNGVALRAANILIAYGFKELKLNRLEIIVLKDNLPSKKVAEKTGAKLECLATNKLVSNGKASDAFVYALVP